MSGNRDVNAGTEAQDPDLELVAALKLLLSHVDRGRMRRVLRKALDLHLVDGYKIEDRISDVDRFRSEVQHISGALDPSFSAGSYPIGRAVGVQLQAQLDELNHRLYTHKSLLGEL